MKGEDSVGLANLTADHVEGITAFAIQIGVIDHGSGCFGRVHGQGRYRGQHETAEAHGHHNLDEADSRGRTTQLES